MPQVELMSGDFRSCLDPNAMVKDGSGFLMFAHEALIGQLVYSRDNQYMGMRVR